MSSGSISKYLALMLSLLLVASVGGVFAIWHFAEEPAETKSGNFGIGINEFTWKPEEILPDDEEIGKDYLNLLESITNNNKMGLNSGKGNVIKSTAKQYGYVHCDQQVTGGNLKHLKDFFTSADNELDFVIGYGDETTLYVYMFEADAAQNAFAGTTYINVYMTIMKYEAVGGVKKWVAKESQQGYAIVKFMPNSNYRGILPEDWKRGAIPASLLA